MPVKKRALWGWVGLGALVLGTVAAFPFIRLGLAASRAGFFEQAKPETYEASRTGNLQAIQTAIDLAYDSDGQFPDSKAWMDTLFTRMKTDNLTEAQAKEKLHRPGIAVGGFGYALNPEVAGKLKRELAPETVTVFESADSTWNATGLPSKASKGSYGLTVAGDLVELPSLKKVTVAPPVPVPNG